LKRRTHSTLDSLPAAVRDALTKMVVDGLWPADCPGEHEGRPTYDDMVEYCVLQGLSVSRSAIGRWAKGLRVIEDMKTAGLIARNTMAGMTGEDAPKTQKAAAEYMTAIMLNLMVTEGAEFSPKQIKEVSQGIRDCAQVAINADKHIRTALAEKVKEAGEKIERIAKKKNIDPDVLKRIREEVYGIVT